jgi:LAO/AO transport system kinase
MHEEHSKPEWVPPEGGIAFATQVTKGVEGRHDGMPYERSKPTRRTTRPGRRQLSAADYVEGVLNNDRVILARAITLIESNSPAHIEVSQEVLQHLLPHTGQSIRIGITGVPGVGKSTFIETFGSFLCNAGHRVAVLAVDPSSSITRGSILGDKTRMEQLSRHPNAFIRPSPSGGTLGGVTRKSRETMLVCEAGGFDVILVETVGVGQGETAVRSMVDFFLLLMLTGAGDELQGFKKGIMELCDAIVINKADGDNKPRALVEKQEYNRVLHYLAPATEGWQTRAYTCSSLTGAGIADIWEVIETFRQTTTESGVFSTRRTSQMRDWVYTMVEEHIKTRFYQHPEVQRVAPQIEQAVVSGAMPPTAAVHELLRVFEDDVPTETPRAQ